MPSRSLLEPFASSQPYWFCQARLLRFFAGLHQLPAPFRILSTLLITRDDLHQTTLLLQESPILMSLLLQVHISTNKFKKLTTILRTFLDLAIPILEATDILVHWTHQQRGQKKVILIELAFRHLTKIGGSRTENSIWSSIMTAACFTRAWTHAVRTMAQQLSQLPNHNSALWESLQMVSRVTSTWESTCPSTCPSTSHVPPSRVTTTFN